MIARVADHCFWLGRYLERSESTARVLSVTRSLSLDGELAPRQCWAPLVTVCGEMPSFVERLGQGALGDGETVQEYMTWDERTLASIARTVGAARDNARAVRDVLTLEVWESINELYLWLGSDEARGEYLDRRHDFYRHIRREVQLVLGLLRSTMLRDGPLDFVWLGVLLERLGQTARTLDMHSQVRKTFTPAQAQEVVETALSLSLLRACSGFEPFLRCSQGRVSAQAAASFLVLEPRFPRSIKYCARVALERLSDICGPRADASTGSLALARLGDLDAYLQSAPAEIDTSLLHPLLTHVVSETSEVCALVGTELLGG